MFKHGFVGHAVSTKSGATVDTAVVEVGEFESLEQNGGWNPTAQKHVSCPLIDKHGLSFKHGDDEQKLVDSWVVGALVVDCSSRNSQFGP